MQDEQMENLQPTHDGHAVIASKVPKFDLCEGRSEEFDQKSMEAEEGDGCCHTFAPFIAKAKTVVLSEIVWKCDPMQQHCTKGSPQRRFSQKNKNKQ